ncbi:unnamed protein product, partial [Staurois parvus]
MAVLCTAIRSSVHVRNRPVVPLAAHSARADREENCFVYKQFSSPSEM